MSLRLKCYIFVALSCSFLPSAVAENVNNQSIIRQKQANLQERPSFGKYFQQAGVKGSFYYITSRRINIWFTTPNAQIPVMFPLLLSKFSTHWWRWKPV